MAFLWKDNVIYDEIWDQTPGTGVAAQTAAVIQDVFGFYIKTAETATEETIFVYRCRQVEADKETGSGEEIEAGDRLFYHVATDKVSQNHGAGTFGVDYYFCGWAKKDAAASDTTVLMNFDGTRWDEDIDE